MFSKLQGNAVDVHGTTEEERKNIVKVLRANNIPTTDSTYKYLDGESDWPAEAYKNIYMYIGYRGGWDFILALLT